MRADRLLSIMLMLHAHGRMTVQTLADQLGVSMRTIYRDIDALSIASIPIYTQPGNNGGVFLDEDYRVSLTGLSKPEVLALFIPTDSRPQRDLGMGKAAEDALMKLFAALPTIYRSEAERMRERYYIDPMHWFQADETPTVLGSLQQALWEDRQIDAVYQSYNGEERQRIIEPYGLVSKALTWYLVGKKPDTNETRVYRVARFKRVSLLDKNFTRIPFDLAAYWKGISEQFKYHADDLQSTDSQ